MTYQPLSTMPFSDVRKIDEAQKPDVLQRQHVLLDRRSDLSDKPITGITTLGA
ncbi:MULTISPECIES: hypothetical protein [unclassified Rhizobium]|uniref:hypothetical protein n=1 Tax=unclassified Rhizobium TaxID=2613769 RepID=UPI001674570F|nr:MULTISPECIES: hypothetical protein [unclassified Rhizobium]